MIGFQPIAGSIIHRSPTETRSSLAGTKTTFASTLLTVPLNCRKHSFNSLALIFISARVLSLDQAQFPAHRCSAALTALLRCELFFGLDAG